MMTSKLRPGHALVLTAVLSATTFVSNDARACGGCFHPPPPPDPQSPETTVVTAHRMAFSISMERTVLWDQVQYAGAPAEFAWVLPVRTGATIDVASDAWFDALDAATSTRVMAPYVWCDWGNSGQGDFGFDGPWEESSRSGCDCGGTHNSSSGFGSGGGIGTSAGSGSGGNSAVPQPPPVTVVHQGSVGPYETVTLHANVPGALPNWLASNGFAVDASVQPIIDAYEAEGFDFIALRLLPDQSVKQMKPVRVISPGATPILPLRMVSAGTGANVSLTLFVIGEGRWESQNFPNALFDSPELRWDFATQSSNYSVLRQQLLAEGGNRTWLTSYAKLGTLLSPLVPPVQYSVGSSLSNTIGNFFVDQGFLNAETSDTTCKVAFAAHSTSSDLVVDVCQSQSGGGGGGDNCGVAGPGEIDSREFACDTLDDMAAALVGMHPRDVWLTRIEATLARDALSEDFILQAADAQDSVENWITAPGWVNTPCPAASAANISPGKGGSSRKARTEMAWIGTALLAAAAAVLRRPRRRPTPV